VKISWWKHLTAVWLTAVIIAGFWITIPDIPILRQTARNIFFHVPMWFTMYGCYMVSAFYAVRYLQKRDTYYDRRSVAFLQTGVYFGTAGILTGSLWARFTWGSWWTFAEPRMNLAAIALLMFASYLFLRDAIDEPVRRARLSAVYNLFAFSAAPFLFYIVPRQLPSLHPGAEGNPAFSEITAPEIRYVLYPAFIGFMALGVWMATLRYRVITLEEHND
jgi:heme exporter protein C